MRTSRIDFEELWIFRNCVILCGCILFILQVTLFRVVNVNSVKTDVVNLSKRQNLRRNPGQRKRRKANISIKARGRNLPPVTKVPGLTSLQAIFQEFREFHILQLPEKLVPVA